MPLKRSQVKNTKYKYTVSNVNPDIKTGLWQVLMEYPAQLSYLHLQSLERRRLTADLILTYRIIFGLVDVCKSDNFLS